MLLIGFYSGGALSILRYLSNAWIFSIKQNNENKLLLHLKTIVLFFGNQILLLTLLFIYFSLNRWLFIGLIAGVLLAPFIVVINSITEVFGITKNGFYLN
jgi:hypothetical protein